MKTIKNFFLKLFGFKIEQPSTPKLVDYSGIREQFERGSVWRSENVIPTVEAAQQYVAQSNLVEPIEETIELKPRKRKPRKKKVVVIEDASEPVIKKKKYYGKRKVEVIK